MMFLLGAVAAIVTFFAASRTKALVPFFTPGCIAAYTAYWIWIGLRAFELNLWVTAVVVLTYFLFMTYTLALGWIDICDALRRKFKKYEDVAFFIELAGVSSGPVIVMYFAVSFMTDVLISDPAEASVLNYGVAAFFGVYVAAQYFTGRGDRKNKALPDTYSWHRERDDKRLKQSHPIVRDQDE